jgi:arylsulfatase A-like enzyme
MARNVLYITVDSIRADHVGHLGYDEPTTPRLDDLADRGTVCTRAIANGIPTFYSFKSLLGGVSSLGHSTGIGMPAQTTTLAEAFRDRGYRTAGFNAGNAWLTRGHGYDRGFESFRDFITDETDETESAFSGLLPVLQRAQSLVEGLEFVEDKAGFVARTAFSLLGRQPLEDAETITEAALDWLGTHASGDRPFFLWIHYMDPHYPWVPRAVDLEPFCDDRISALEKGRLWHKVAYLNNATDGDPVSPSELARITDLYDAEIYRTDTAIGRLLDALDTHGVRDETVVSVVGDHGTELQDHGGFSHGPRKLYNELVHVPLLFAGAGVPTRTVSGTTSLLDVAPTLLDVAADGDDGRDVPADFVGHSIFEQSRERAVTEVVYDHQPVSGANADNDLLVSCIEWPWKLIVNHETGTTELYDLASDPGEQSDLSGASRHRDVIESLRTALETTRSDVERRNNTRAEEAHVRSTVAALKRAEEI